MHRDPQRSHPLLWWVRALPICALLLAPSGAHAQVVRMVAPDNFRIEPNQAVIASLEPGTELSLLQTLDTWVEVELEGWMWARSLQVVDREGFDLVVSATEGENLRERPQGEMVARLEEGTLLEELERIPGWILVRRRGFVWAASTEIEASAASAAAAVDLPSVSGTASGSSAQQGSGTRSPGASTFSVEAGTLVRTAPDGDSLLTTGADSRVAVVGSEGEWARVLVEGWVRIPEGARVDARSSAIPTGPEGASVDEVVANPAAMVGSVVSWELQFISLERASELRAEFDPGEPYLLMRPAGEGTGRFVYVAIPEAQASEAENFVPLERFTVRGRVRTGASAVSGAPVLDLIEMSRRR